MTKSVVIVKSGSRVDQVYGTFANYDEAEDYGNDLFLLNCEWTIIRELEVPE